MTVGIIAGSGSLPELLSAETAGVLVRLKGVATTANSKNTIIEAEFERLGELFAALHDEGVTKLVFAGAMQRPALDPARLDATTMQLAPRIMAALAKGDDGLLREVLAIFTEAGFEIVAAHDLLPDLLVMDGIMCGAELDKLQNHALRGTEILAALSPLDVGQGCVVSNGQCIGIETLQGTDQLLKFVQNTRGQLPKGGVLVKRAKSGQDLRIDMPTIGPATIKAVSDAGLTGICLQAGHVMVLDRAQTIQLANDAGITIWASA